MKRLIQSIAAAGLIAAFSAPTLAQGPTQNSASPEASAPQAGRSASRERRICVYQEMTGSRLPRKICQTQREWDREGGVPTDR